MHDGIPFVSVIVPVYNREKLIGSCIDALLNQDYPNDKYEVIIVDNNSTDSTRDIVQGFPDVVYVLEKAKGSYSARNTGIRASKGQILAFTDSDCIAASDWIRELIKGFEDPRVGCCAGKIEGCCAKTLVQQFCQDERILDQERFFRGEVMKPAAITANVAYRKEVVREIGLFNPCVRSSGDIDFCWRMQYETLYTITYNQNAVVFHNFEHRFGDLLKRAFFIGKWLAWLITKYPRSYEERDHSFFYYYSWSVVLTLLSFLKLPINVIAFRGKYGMLKSVAYPVFHKLVIVLNHLGICYGLLRIRRYGVDGGLL